MTAEEFLTTNLRPGVAWYSGLPGWNIPTDDRAELLMLTYSGVESAWTDRVQSGNGPAHSFYQMERMGGVNGVLTHPATKKLAGESCQAMHVSPDAAHAWSIMATEHGDNLATAFARLLLWTDPAPLPQVGSPEMAWQYYLRLWQPGKPDHNRFTERYGEAINAINAINAPKPHPEA